MDQLADKFMFNLLFVKRFYTRVYCIHHMMSRLCLWETRFFIKLLHFIIDVTNLGFHSIVYDYVPKKEIVYAVVRSRLSQNLGATKNYVNATLPYITDT